LKEFLIKFNGENMKILVLGSTGMLGNAVAKHFIDKGYDITCTYRNKSFQNYYNNLIEFDALSCKDFSFLNKFDYVINCIGTIKPFMNNNMVDSIYINSILPRNLSNYCESKKIKFIHITSDCVFSGKDGNYNEDSLHDCLDEYGKSKSLGEPKNCMTLRTSIIGEEIHKNASLIAWAKSMKGQKINGYVNHLWNGITTKHYAEICEQIIRDNLYSMGLFHIYSNSISKYELLNLLNDHYELELDINQFQDINIVDRTLKTKKDLLSKLKIKLIQQQIAEL